MSQCHGVQHTWYNLLQSSKENATNWSQINVWCKYTLTEVNVFSLYNLLTHKPAMLCVCFAIKPCLHLWFEKYQVPWIFPVSFLFLLKEKLRNLYQAMGLLHNEELSYGKKSHEDKSSEELIDVDTVDSNATPLLPPPKKRDNKPRCVT